MSRRTLHFICGIAVLFASILYAHVFHHVFFVERQEWNVVFVAGFVVSAVAGLFVFVGAYLLLTGGRSPNAK
jgi:hypothetical protein